MPRLIQNFMNNRRMRRPVCFIAECGVWGGAEAHTLALIKLLLSKGVEVEYVSCRENYLSGEFTGIDDPRLKIIHTDLSIYDRGEEIPGLWQKEFRLLRSRVLIFQHLSADHGSLVFLRSCRKFFKKIYFIEHTLPHPMPEKISKRHFGGLVKGLGLWWYRERRRRREVADCPDRAVAVCDRARLELIREWGYAGQNIITVHNGTDWKKFQSDRRSRDQIVQRYNIPVTATVFGILGRLSYEKGIEDAIEAFRMMAEKDPGQKIYLVIIGVGPDEQKLKDLAEEYSLGEKIKFAGFIDRPETILPAVDFILFTSQREGLPLALLEGMAAGCLPIVYRVGGMPEVVGDSQAGWMVEPGDVAGFSKAMEEAMLLDETTVRQKRQRAVDHIKENFDARKSYQRVLDVFEIDGSLTGEKGHD